MFAWQGFMEAAAWTEDESDAYGGQIGAASDLRQVVGTLHRVLCEYLASERETDFPGVLDYEVSEPLGAWYRRNRDADPGAAQAEARRLVEQFFNPQRRTPSVALMPMLDAHRAAVQLLRCAGFVVTAPPIARPA